MSLVMTTVWLICGLLLGVALVIGLADRFADVLLKRILKSNKTGWCLSQYGNQYELEPLAWDDDENAYHVKGQSEDERDYIEDENALMLSLLGVPFGLRLASYRVMADIESATAGHEVAERVADGGELEDDESLSLDDIKERLVIGTREEGNVKHVYANPFKKDSDSDRIVDLRQITSVLSNQARTDTPRKAAKNAIEAERAIEDGGWGNIATHGMILAAFILGAVVASYFPGGGGGAPDVSIGIISYALPLL